MANEARWRKASIETLRSARDTVGKVRTGHTYFEPRPGSLFVLYREDGKFMRTSTIQQVTAEAKSSDSNVFEFETKNSKYRVTLQEELDSAQLPS